MKSISGRKLCAIVENKLGVEEDLRSAAIAPSLKRYESGNVHPFYSKT
ncbi:MAG: hypothetical protein WCA35_31650 [Kovacikia sp.]